MSPPPTPRRGTCEDAQEGGARQLDRQRPGVLRLLHLRDGRRAGVRQGLLPGVRSCDRHAAVVRHLRRGLCGTADRRLLHGPHRRQVRPQARADPHRDDDGRVDVPRRLPPVLRRDRAVGAGAAGCPAPDAGLLGLGRAGERELAHARACARRPARVLYELHAERHAGRPHHRHRRLPADRHPPGRPAADLGLAHPVLAQRLRGARRRADPAPAGGDPGFQARRRGRDAQDPAGRAVERPPRRRRARHARGAGVDRQHDLRRLRAQLRRRHQGLDRTTMLWVSIVTNVIALAALPAWAILSDRDRAQAGVHLRRDRQRRADVRLSRRDRERVVAADLHHRGPHVGRSSTAR